MVLNFAEIYLKGPDFMEFLASYFLKNYCKRSNFSRYGNIDFKI